MMQIDQNKNSLVALQVLQACVPKQRFLIYCRLPYHCDYYPTKMIIKYQKSKSLIEKYHKYDMIIFGHFKTF